MSHSSDFSLRAEGGAALLGREPVRWAMQKLAAALEARGLTRSEEGAELAIEVRAAADADARRLAETEGVELPHAAESFALLREPGRIVAIGADTRGLVYA